ncbi:unnamed protein product, partial [Owenia fusiformis]
CICSVESFVQCRVVSTMIEYTNNVNAKDKNGLTTLMYALSSKGCDDVVRLLLEKGAGVNIRDRNGMSPLMYAVNGLSSKSIVKLLIDKGAELNAKDNDGKTVLQHSIDLCSAAIVKCLLQAGARVDVPGYDGLTALAYTVQRCEENTDAIVKLLTKYKSNVNAIDRQNRTCLMLAIETTKGVPSNRMPRMFYVLRYIIKGADVSLRDKDGQSAADIAMKCGLSSTLKDVIDLSTDNTNDN